MIEINNYEAKKQARIERMKNRISRLRQFAEGKDLSMFGESKSGIPLGQPIIVGHHSERRHRRHLERIERIVRAGYNASDKADQLESRLEAIESSDAIQVDNPDAKNLIHQKIATLEKSLEYSKKMNKLMSKFDDLPQALEHFKKLDDPDSKFLVKHLESRAHWYHGTKKIQLYYFSTTSAGAEIRRLKKRLTELDKVAQGFESFEVGSILVELVDGQIQVEFPDKPSESVRKILKCYPISLKWSSYSKRWVRKHTGSTGTTYRQILKSELEKINSGVTL